MASFCQNYSSRNVLTVFLGFEFSESRPTFFNLVLIIIILIKKTFGKMSVTSRLRKTHMSEQAGKIIEVFKKKFFLFIVIAQKKGGRGTLS